MAELSPGRAPVLVTGAAGFVGSWLVPRLTGAGYAVQAAHRPGERVAPCEDSESVALDLRDAHAVQAQIAKAPPAAVVHLAALAAPRQAAADPLEALRINYRAVDHLIGALARYAPAARLLLVSSGEVYGRRAAEAAPAREEDPLAPSNLYAATKAAAEQRAVLAGEREGLDVVRARPFNHSGPGRPALYAEASFAKQLAEAERDGEDATVRVGNLTPIRDWSDVRDVVDAYLLLLERGEAGAAYNVCRGTGQSVEQLLETLCALSRARAQVRVEPDRYEAVDPDQLALIGNPGRLERLGWSPRHSLVSTLGAVLEDWRARVRA